MGPQLSILELLYCLRWYIALALGGIYAWRSYQSHRRLSHIPGPWLAQRSQLWLLKSIYGGQLHLEMHDVSRKYGPLARIGPNMLTTSSVEQFQRMSAAKSPYTRSEWYIGFRLLPGVDNALSMRDDKIHAKRRAQINMGYTGKEDINIEPTVDTHLMNLISLIRNRYISTLSDMKIMDLAEKVNFFTMDVIVDLATGAPFGDLVADKDIHDYSRTMAELQPLFAIVGVMGWVSRIIQIPAIGKHIFPNSQDEFGMGKLIAIAQGEVRERLDPDKTAKEKPDILQSFINHGLSEEETISEALLLLPAGSDTTASAICGTMLHIMTSPLVYARLQAEIDEAIRAGKISNPVVQESEAKCLSYLQAVILEGLRISPPTGGLQSKVVPPEGDAISGVFVPGGTEIASNTWSIVRDRDIFGQEPEVFSPERWLDVSKEQYDRMARVVDLIFGYGKSKCLGRTTAMIELNKVLIELLRNFDFTVVNPTKPLTVSSTAIILHRDFFVRVTERNIKS